MRRRAASSSPQVISARSCALRQRAGWRARRVLAAEDVLGVVEAGAGEPLRAGHVGACQDGRGVAVGGDVEVVPDRAPEGLDVGDGPVPEAAVVAAEGEVALGFEPAHVGGHVRALDRLGRGLPELLAHERRRLLRVAAWGSAGSRARAGGCAPGRGRGRGSGRGVKFAARFRASGSIASGTSWGRVVVGGGDRAGLEAGDGACAQAGDARGEGVGREAVAERPRRGSGSPLRCRPRRWPRRAGETRASISNEIVMPSEVTQRTSPLPTESIARTIVLKGSSSSLCARVKERMPSMPHSSPPVRTTQTSRFSRGSSSSFSARERATATPGCVVVRARDDLARGASRRGGSELTRRMSVGMIWRIARPSESTPAMRAPSMGRRIAADQKRRRVWGKGRKPEMRLETEVARLAEDRPGAGGVDVGGEDQLVRRVGVLAARDDVLRRAAEEEEAEEVAARVEVEVEGRGRDEERGRSRRPVPGSRGRWRRRRGRRGGPRRAAPAGGRRWARPRSGALRRAGGRPWRSRRGARSRCRPGGARTSRARRSSRAWGRCLGRPRLGRSRARPRTPASSAGVGHGAIIAGWMRRVGVEPTCPFGQGLLSPLV